MIEVGGYTALRTFTVDFANSYSIQLLKDLELEKEAAMQFVLGDTLQGAPADDYTAQDFKILTSIDSRYSAINIKLAQVKGIVDGDTQDITVQFIVEAFGAQRTFDKTFHFAKSQNQVKLEEIPDFIVTPT